MLAGMAAAGIISVWQGSMRSFTSCTDRLLAARTHKQHSPRLHPRETHAKRRVGPLYTDFSDWLSHSRIHSQFAEPVPISTMALTGDQLGCMVRTLAPIVDPTDSKDSRQVLQATRATCYCSSGCPLPGRLEVHMHERQRSG